MARVFVGLGSNIEPARHILQAVRLLGGVARLVAISTIYQTPARGQPGQPAFCNGVVELRADLPPRALKRELARIEAALGRRRTADRYAPRTIDLDLLLYDDLAGDEPGLHLPHPDIERRAFVAEPLRALAPGLRLPGSGKPITDVARALLPAPMRPLPWYTARLRKELPHEPRQSRAAGCRAFGGAG